MSNIDWYNENSNRHFPLVPRDAGTGAAMWPKSAMLDMGIVLGGESEFTSETDYVWFERVERSGDYIILVFVSSTQPTLEITATFDADPLVTPFGSIVDLVFEGSDQGHGFVVVGDTTVIAAFMALNMGFEDLDEDEFESMTALEFYALVPDESTLDVAIIGGGDVEVEPSRVSSQALAIVTTIDALHRPPTQWSSSCEESSSDAGSSSSDPGSSDSGSSSSDPGSSDFTEVIDGLVGPLFLDDGYNTDVVINEEENSITIRAAIGAGIGEPCNWEDQGEPWCWGIIASINGILASDNGSFTIQGGPGVEVVALGDHGLIVQIGNVADMYCSTPG